MIDFDSKKIVYTFKVYFRDSKRDIVYYFTDKKYADEAMVEFMSGSQAFVSKARGRWHNPMMINTFDVRCIEVLPDKGVEYAD